MVTELMTEVLHQFGVVEEEVATTLEARSGSAIVPARFGDDPVFVKITPADLGMEALRAARRELEFYRSIAPRARFRTPRLLNSMDGPEGVALLLTSEGSVRPVTAWTQEMWTELGHQLALAHQTQVGPEADTERTHPLVAAMTEPDLGAIVPFWEDALPQLPLILERTGASLEQLAQLPTAFTHGDCHTSNIVLAQPQLTDQPLLALCDWQACGTGWPIADLAFVSVRATPEGVHIPEALTRSYAATSGYAAGRLGQELILHELMMFIYIWPAFAAYQTPIGVRRIQARARTLAKDWQGGHARSKT